MDVATHLLKVGVLVLYLATLALMMLYALHRCWLVFLHYRTRRCDPVPTSRFADWPAITVQIPLYNEPEVVERVLGAVAKLSYPSDRLQIQVLDDSTDDTTSLARRCAQGLAACGPEAHLDEAATQSEDTVQLGPAIEVIHRDDRDGFKAGALAAGLDRATGEFIAVFDADFVPTPDFLERSIHHFTDPQVGVVQGRWGHLNRDESWMTEAQAVYLDSHFAIEHGARNRSGRFMSFNGTAGIWRRAAIESAGGWEGDTLTEDLDLSYRAQLAGWRFIYLNDVTVPAELPAAMAAYKSQQHRWAKGAIQTARKLLGRILQSEQPWKVKLEAFFHLTSATMSIWMLIFALLLFPAFYLRFVVGMWPTTMVAMDVLALLLTMGSAALFLVAGQRELTGSWWVGFWRLPFMMSFGIGMSVNNARAVVEAVVGHSSEFIRTSKRGARRGGEGGDVRWRKWPVGATVELVLGMAYLGLAVWASRSSIWMSVPFLLLLASGFLLVGGVSLAQSGRRLMNVDDPRRKALAAHESAV